MKAFLMHESRDLDLAEPLPENADDLIFDLELGSLLEVMSDGDPLVAQMAKRVLLRGLDDPSAIGYRQAVLADCLDNRETISELYQLARDGVNAERRVWGLPATSADSVLHRAIQVMDLFVGILRRLRSIADKAAGGFGSAGFRRFFEMVSDELDDEYFKTVEAHLKELRFPKGVLISARLGRGNTATDYVLRRREKRRLLEKLSDRRRAAYSFEVPLRDEAGMEALGELRSQGVNHVANALAQSVDHVRSFLTLLAAELAFYIGCINLKRRLSEEGEPLCTPTPTPPGQSSLEAKGLYDAALSLHLDRPVVGNDLAADGKRLIVITGANQGGKSTLLRAIGQAQLMMQSGMFVAAHDFTASVTAGVFTHYKREEDATMESGKLDEELRRMQGIVRRIRAGCLLLCNESFASTNEREAAEINRQVLGAMKDSGVRVVLVTHLYDLAQSLYRERAPDTTFLRAERGEDGRRPYKIREGEPLATSFGADTYQSVFGKSASRPPPPG